VFDLIFLGKPLSLGDQSAYKTLLKLAQCPDEFWPGVVAEFVLGDVPGLAAALEFVLATGLSIT